MEKRAGNFIFLRKMVPLFPVHSIDKMKHLFCQSTNRGTITYACLPHPHHLSYILPPLFLFCIGLLWASIPLSHAQQSVRSKTYAIPPGPLTATLNRFAEEAGIFLSSTAELADGKTSPGLQGSYTIAEGLSILLMGSGLEAMETADRTYTLKKSSVPPPQSSDEALMLPAMTVVADAESDSGILKPYAGGQVARGGRLGILGNRDFMDTPFNRTSYTAELMQNQQARFIADALNNDPTARAAGSGSTGLDSFSIRGFNVTNADLLFNGLAGVTPSFFNSMMAESIERIEVLKGPNALLNGVALNGGIGGAINMIPKRAADIPLTQFTASYISNTQFSGHIDVGRRFGSDNQFGVRLNGVYRNGDTPIDNHSQESALATLGFNYQSGRLRLSTDLGYQDQDFQGTRRFARVAPGLEVPKAPNNRTNFYDPYEFNDTQVYYGALRGEYDLNNKLTVYTAFGGSVRNQRTTGTNRTIIDALGNMSGGINPVGFSADKMYSWTLEAGLQGRFTTGVLQHQAVLAYTLSDREWRRINVPALSSPYPASNIYKPIYGPEPDSSLQPGPGDARKMQDLTLSSIALVDTLSVFDERVQLTLGTRWQQIDAANFNTNTGAMTSDYKKDKATPMVGLVVKPWQRVSLYANYIQGLQQGPTAPLTATNAGEVFSPFVTKQYEVGAKVDFGRIATTLAFYQVAQPSGIIDPVTNIFSVNGEQRHRGVDFNVFGEVARGVRLLGGVAYIDSELTKTQGGINQGNNGISVPDLRLVIGTEWDIPFIRGLTMDGRVIRNSSIYLDPANTQKTPAWTRLDIGARYYFSKLLTLRANLNNAFGRNYWDTDSFGQLILSDPRTFFVSATFDF